MFNELVSIYRSDAVQDPLRLYESICEAAYVDPGRSKSRLFLDWDEVREMSAGGMDIGSHTVTHPIIGRLSPARQYEEVAVSKEIIEAELAKPVTTLAYPTGSLDTFTDQTFDALRRAGYRAAFSFYGGVNFPRADQPVRRTTSEDGALRSHQSIVAVAACYLRGVWERPGVTEQTTASDLATPRAPNGVQWFDGLRFGAARGRASSGAGWTFVAGRARRLDCCARAADILRGCVR